MTEAYQEPSVDITTQFEDLAADSRAARLPTAIIGECYQVVIKGESGNYTGAAVTDRAYPGPVMSGAQVEHTSGDFIPDVYIRLDGTDYDITDNTGVVADANGVDIPAGTRFTVQTAKTDAVQDGTRIFRSPSANFITNGVRSGDILRDTTANKDYNITAVFSSTRLQLSIPVAAGTISNYIIVRTLGSTENPGTVLISYRAARGGSADAVIGKYIQANSVTDLRNLFGKDAVGTHLNPLGFAMGLALSAGGASVGGVGIDANSSTKLADYQSAIETMDARRVYNIVPLTIDTTHQDVVIQHVKDSSTFANRERRTYITRTILDDRDDLNIAVTDATIAAGNLNSISKTTVNFTTQDIEAGDVIVITGGTGPAVGTEFIITSVAATDLGLDRDGVAAADIDFSIYRDHTRDEQASAAASIAQSLNTERVTLVGPDKITISSGGSNTTVDSYYLAAIKAGQRTGSSIGQPLIRAGIPFVTGVIKGSEHFSPSQLNTMAGAGWQMFVQDGIGSPVYCRDELTTRQGLGPRFGQESEVVARDHASYLFRDSLDQLIGGFNVTPQTISTLQLSANSIISSLLSERFQPFTTIELISVIESTTNPGRVEISVRMTQSDPLVGVDVSIVI